LSTTKLTASDKKVLNAANYIHTTSPKFKKNGATDYNGLVHKISNTSLISLIYGMQQKEFGLNTIWKVMHDIEKYNDMHGSDQCVNYLDSGGYSIISGATSSSNSLKLISCYAHVLKYHNSKQDRILSLDIPFFINEPKMCTVRNIYDLNKKSLELTIDVVKEQPELKNKLMFIQQFKLRRQYQIFNKLYDDLEIWKYMDGHAIGGLVGLGAATDINFAPFIGPAFQAFSRFLNHPPESGFFNLHCLGVYHLHARFIIGFLQNLFESLDEVDHSKITFDTINYLISAQFKCRADHKYCRLNNNEIIHYKNLTDLDREELKYVYPESVISDVNSELDIIKGKNGNVKDVSFSVPLYAFSQLQIDELFLKLIDEYDMVNIFKSAKNTRILTNQFNAIINSIHSKYAFLLGAQFTRKLLLNIQLCYAFYSAWYIKDRTDAKMDELMVAFIKKINFPADLQD